MKKLFTLLIVAMCSWNGILAQNDCATAVPITSIPFSSGVQTTCGTVNDYPAGTLAGSTLYGGGEDYVYALAVSPSNLSLKFDLAGSATYKVMAIHSACPPSTANAIGFINTSTGTSGTKVVTFPSAGVYYIIIDTWPSPTCGEFTLDITLPPAPPSCATLVGPANGSTVATLNPTLSWTAPTTGVAPTSYKVYLGTTNPPTTLVTTITAPTTTYTPTAASAFGTTYYWYVTPSAAGSDAVGCAASAFSFTTPAPPAAPTNDDCANATALTVNPDFACAVTTPGTTVSATQSTETPPSNAATGTNDDVWYKFTATSTAHRISLLNVSGSTDMAMALYSGACGSLVQVQFSDPNTMNVAGLTVGVEYKVRVWTYTSTPGTRASFDICVGIPPPPPSNDNCGTPMALTPGATFAQNAMTVTNAVATNTTDVTATSTCQTTRNKDVWFSVVVPASGNITVETDAATGSAVSDMVLSVYTGSCGALTQVGCDDDGGNGLFSQVVLTGQVPGSTLLIAAFNYSSISEGNFQISAYDGSLATGESIVNENGVKVHPNPFTDFIRISDVKDVVSVSIVDMSGRMVKTVKPANEINLSSLKSGMYLINLKMKDGSVKTVKSIKK